MQYRMRTSECDAIKWTAGPDQEDDPLWFIKAIELRLPQSHWLETVG